MGDDSKKMNVKLVMSKSNHRVLYGDGGEEFIDLLFCFLSFHLCSLAKCLGGCIGMGYFDNLVGAQSQTDKEMGGDSKKMNVKLVMSKSNHRVLYGDGGEEFIDLLFCFLSVHLGSVAKCLGGCIGMGYFDNLVGAQSQTDKEMGGDSKKMNVKLFLSKSNNRVLYAEGGAEFTDLLFSFLAFPLGSIVKCLGGCTDTGCLDNLYKSAEDLSCEDCMISEGCRAMLLNPKLPPYFGTKNQLLEIEDQVPRKPKFVCCATFRGFAAFITSPRICCHSSRRDVQLSTTNPKLPGAVTELGGAFAAGQATFMEIDELAVKPLSTMSGISLLSKFNIPISDIEEQVVCIGEKEAMSLLKASLVSNSVLSNVFYPKNRKQMETKPKRRIF
eukprot:TRINITY_DN3365_c0_g1_i2.p1 TRINITY_DN3365_c0_g1~~TRINITY_DN3365_c0_g1_i2.p1  ORF type:complete len:385 (-),score=59.07 TRINITY_DN3365_c0_g1_i2:651-1805(-)